MLKWNALTDNQKIAVIGSILVPVLIAIFGFFVTSSNEIIQNQTINIGLTLEQHELPFHGVSVFARVVRVLNQC